MKNEQELILEDLFKQWSTDLSGIELDPKASYIFQIKQNYSKDDLLDIARRLQEFLRVKLNLENFIIVPSEMISATRISKETLEKLVDDLKKSEQAAEETI